jgi:putative protease
LEALADSGADAFYLGGKILNMRLHRKDLNFTEEDLIVGREVTASRGQKFYITVNKLLGKDDWDDLGPYLAFLAQEVRPDALIVQDIAVAQKIRDEGLPLAVHASVMANVHNEASAQAWKDLGATRAVLSREASLEDARRIRDRVGLEIEYFVHGDMCIAHGSQCLYSTQVFGQSSNRGACMKPCRWPFSARWEGQEYEAAFPLAVKDMNMHGHIPELLAAGVTSFKIEGRMRDAEYVGRLVRSYADSLDRYLSDPGHYDPNVGAEELEEHRKRDFTTAYALGRPGTEILNVRWEGTGKFYSTGKVFSSARQEPASSERRVAELLEAWGGLPRPEDPQKPELAVRVDTLDQARAAWARGAEVVILSGDPFLRTERVPERSALAALREAHPGKHLALQLPRMHLDEADAEAWREALGRVEGLYDELYVGYWGAHAKLPRGAKTWVADPSVNALNSETARIWVAQGASLVSTSLEAGRDDFGALLASGLPLEVTVQGRLTAMYMENDAYRNALRGPHRAAAGEVPFGADVLCLVDAEGAPHPVLNDRSGRSHLLTTRTLSLWPLVPTLVGFGVRRLRVETALLSEEDLALTVAAYRQTLDGQPCRPPVDSLGTSLEALAWN